MNRARLFVSVTAVVVVTGGGVAWAMNGSDGPSYRLARVALGSVSQSVESTGTIASANSATLRFPVSGQVASVAVSVGDQVTAGQTVAKLSTTTLEQQLQSARAAAAAARQALAADETAQANGSSDAASDATSNGSTGSSASDGSNGSSSRPGGGSDASTTALTAAVRAAQRRVLDDQRTADVDADLAAADKAIAAEDAACAALLATSPASPTDTPTDSPTTPSPAPTDSGDDTSTDLQSCQDAIAAVQAAQHKVAADLDTLVQDERALDQAISKLLAALAKSGSSGGSSPQPTASSTASSTSGNTSTGSNGRSSANGTSHVPTAADLAADQKKIDAADAQVTVAQQNVDQASLTTPIDGTVAAVSLSVGEQVSAGSSTATITVLGRGQKTVTTTVTLANRDLVKVGQTAHVTVDGMSTPITGKVSQIGFLNTSGTSGSTTTYPITIVLDTTAQLYDGAGAAVVIDVGSVHGVLTVPTSAITRTGTQTSVTVYRNGKISTRRVTLGVQGIDSAEVTAGLSAGEQVVLATVSAPVPSNSTDTGRFARRFTGSGGLGGSGLSGGGLGGGR